MSEQKQKGHGAGKVAPFTQSPGSGKGNNWPQGESVPNAVPKEWKSGKGSSAPKPK